MQDFREQTGVTFRLAADESTTLGQLARPRGVDAPFPRGVVIDRNLVIRANKRSFDAAETQALIDSLLAE